MSQKRPTRRDALTLGLIAPAAALGAAPPSPSPAPIDGPAKEAAEGRVKAAGQVLDLYQKFLMAPPGTQGIPRRADVADEIPRWSRLVADGRIELAGSADERLEILAKEAEAASEFLKKMIDLAGDPTSDMTRVTVAKLQYYLVDCQARLLKAKAGP